MIVYAMQYGATVTVKDDLITVKQKEVKLSEHHVLTLDTVIVSTKCQITSQCIQILAKNKVDILWVTSTGAPVGGMYNRSLPNIMRQKMQFDLLNHESFLLKMARQIVCSKISNQHVFLQRLTAAYNKEKTIPAPELNVIMRKCTKAKNTEVLIGYEGISSKFYFYWLKKYIPPQYGFDKRSKNPPRDCANAVLSFLYTLLYNDMILAIHAAGLNAHVGVMHKISPGHAALASDLMEEFRPIIADSVFMDYLRNYTPDLDSFVYHNNGAVYLKYESTKQVISLYETKMNSKTSYLKKDGVKRDFRSLLQSQVYDFINALENTDPSLYTPVRLR